MKELKDPNHFLKFLLVGMTGMVIDNIILYGLTNYTGLFVLLNKIVSAEASIAVMFVLNDRWTFKQQTDGTVFKRFIKSNSVRFVGMVVGIVSFYTFYRMGVHLILANILGIGIGFVFNYLFESLWTWKKVDSEDLFENFNFLRRK